MKKNVATFWTKVVAICPSVFVRMITAIPVDGAVSSLSAILLDDDYYRFLRSGRRENEAAARQPKASSTAQEPDAKPTKRETKSPKDD